MKIMKNKLAAFAAGIAVVGAGFIIPATVAAGPASAMGSCQTVYYKDYNVYCSVSTPASQCYVLRKKVVCGP